MARITAVLFFVAFLMGLAGPVSATDVETAVCIVPTQRDALFLTRWLKECKEGDILFVTATTPNNLKASTPYYCDFNAQILLDEDGFNCRYIGFERKSGSKRKP